MRAFGSCFESHYRSKTVPGHYLHPVSRAHNTFMHNHPVTKSNGATQRAFEIMQLSLIFVGKQSSWLDLPRASFPMWKRSQCIWTRPHRCKGLLGARLAPMAVVRKVSFQQVWASIQPQIRETRQTAHKPFGFLVCSNSTHTNTHTQTLRFTAVFLGRATIASCFGTSAEKVPLYICSSKQAEQMLRAKSQSTNISAAVTPHLTEPPIPAPYSHYVWLQWQTRLRAGSEPDWVCFYSNMKPEWLSAFGMSFQPRDPLTHLESADGKRMCELPLHLMHAHLQILKDLAWVWPSILSAGKQHDHVTQHYWTKYLPSLALALGQMDPTWQSDATTPYLID